MGNKYGAIPTEVDGIRFASKREAKRYQDLKLLERAKVIRDLELQPRFKIEVGGLLICTYVADFQYRVCTDNRLVVEDSKGVETAVFKLKRKLLKAVHGVSVETV